MSEIKFKISAPGRLILSGEHTAAYGKYCLSTSIDLRTTLEFYELSDEEEFIYINFLNVILNTSISLQEVRKFFDSSDEAQKDPVSIIHFVKALITINGMWSTSKQRCSLKIFFFLFFTIAYKKKLQIKPFRVLVSSDIPINAGLGSSTSFAVCVAACFLHWKRLQNGDRSTNFEFYFKESIKDYAIFCEKFLQDYECADVDAAVCAHGKMIKSHFTSYINVSTEMYSNMKNLSVLLVDTKIRMQKHKRAKDMTKIKKFESNFNSYLTELEDCATNIESSLNNIKCCFEMFELCKSDFQDHLWQTLKKCIEHNQSLLQKYQLSNPTIEKICSIANQVGYSAKLTGYRDGFVYILLPLNITKENVQLIKTNILSCPELENCEITHILITRRGLNMITYTTL